jgi:tetratricopeptide (TPR) repeat protein
VPEIDGGKLKPALSPAAEAVWVQFETAWQKALEGAPVPELAAYLQGFAGPESALLGQELARLEGLYRARLASEGQTLPEPGEASESRPPSEATLQLDETPDTEIGTLPLADATQPRPEATYHVAAADSAEQAATLAPDIAANLNSASFALTTATAGPTERPVIPDFEIVDILGRGAMGVVYKARQVSLNRLVALKMILSGGHASEAEVERFRVEAEAAARLQHPHIVQVYGFGVHEGRPYLWLEFVNGDSLQKTAAGVPQPVVAAARLVQQLAQAMECAHQQGIVHRDLKPANVLLAAKPPAAEYIPSAKPPAAEYIPKITDFGLAKRLEDESSQTRTGSILGTPSYMAPEQAEGRSREVSPLADVYALGAILYELITGRPPFRGPSVLETLEQVRTQEPVPPSRLLPRVPHDLETICLKCLQKEPHKRYASAATLAEDLRRFVAGEPIRARPVSTAERLWRWSRRNPRVALLTAAVFTMLLTVAVGATWFALMLSREKAATLQAQREAEENAARERDARNLADQKAREAQEAQAIAGKQRALALGTLRTLITKVQQHLSENGQARALRQELLQAALDGLKQVSAASAADTGLRDRGLASVHNQMAQIFEQLGRTEEAYQQYRQMHTILKALAEADPQSDLARGNLAVAEALLGDLSLRRRGEPTEARAHYLEALRLRKDVVDHPHTGEIKPADARRYLAASYDSLGVVTRDLHEVHDYYRKALELREALAAAEPNKIETQQALARSYLLLAESSHRLQDDTSAQSYYAKALESREALVRAQPQSRNLQQERTIAREMLAGFRLMIGETARARDEYMQSVQEYQKLLEGDPQNVFSQRDLSRAYYGIATACLRLGDGKAAARYYGESLKLRETEARRDPNNTAVQKTLMVTLARCGQHERATSLAEQLRKRLASDAGSLYDIGTCYALCAGAVAQGKDKGQLSSAERRLYDRYLAATLEALRQAFAQGFQDRVLLQTDPDWDPIAKDPGFTALQAQLNPSQP